MNRRGVRTATPASPAAASRTSWAVTTLFFLLLRLWLRLCRGLFGLGGRPRRSLVLRVVLAALSVVFLHDPGHVHHQITRRQVHDLHALGVAARNADALDRHADHDPLLGDHHQLVVGEHLLEGDDVARLVRTLQGDDAPAAAVLHPVLIELGALAHALLGDGEQRGLAAHDHHVDHLVLLVELDPFHAGGRASHVPHVLLVETDAHAVVRGEHDVVPAVGHLHVDQLVALFDVDGANADGARVAELRQPRLLHHALFGGEQEKLVLRELAHGYKGREALVGLHGDAGDDRLAARGPRRLRDLMHLQPVTLTLLGEEHHVVVGRRDEQVLNPVVFLRMGGDHAPAATPLASVGRHRQSLDVARMGHGDHHVLFRDQVFDRELALVRDDLGAPLVAEAVRQLRQLLFQDLQAPRLRPQDLLALLDELSDFPELVLELGDLEGGEPGEPHVEDFRRLLFGQLEALAQAGVRALRVLRLADDLHDLVDVVDGDLQAFEDVLAVLRALELELGAADDDGVAVLDEVLEQLLQVHLLRRAVDQGEHDRAEGGLHLRVRVEPVQHHHRDGVPLQLDHDPDAFLVGFVPEIADPLQLLRHHQVTDLFDHPIGRDLVGELGDDDLLLAGGLPLLDGGPRADRDPAAALLVALLDALTAVDDRAGREVRALDELPQILDRCVRVVDQMIDGLDRLAQVVRRDVGRHADRDSGRAVDDEVGEPRREHGGLLQAVVEVGDEIDRALVDIVEYRHRDACQARFRVTVGGRGIAVHRAEVPLTVHQRVAQREGLHHAHQRVVQRHVAVRVILAEHVADHGGALLVRAAGDEPQLVHGVQDAAVHGLEPVAHVGQRALHDHAHRIVEERLLELVFDEARDDPFAGVGSGHETSVRC